MVASGAMSMDGRSRVALVVVDRLGMRAVRRMRRFARELEPGDRVWLFKAWRTVADLVVEFGIVMITFADGAATRLPVWTRVRCWS